MQPKISIIIPSMRHLEDCLRPCLESIVKWTDLTDIECVVVLNGCGDDGSKEFVESLGAPFRYVWLDEASGYTHSTNVGIHAANGEYVILLNNDVVILGAHWIDLLLQPFLDDPTVGITGPLMLHCPDADEEFLVFFLVMINRKCLESIGGELDEIFSPGYGEDCAAAIEARRAGWKVLQVPPGQSTLIDKGCEDLPEWKRDKMWTNPYPAFHDGNKSFGEDPERFEKILERNKRILQERYGNQNKMNTPTDNCQKHGSLKLDGICIDCERENGIELWRASVVDGWFGIDEMAWLAARVKELPKGARVLECGSWHGRSSRAIADNLPEDGQAWFCDTWVGSSGEDAMHGSAHQDRGDNAHQWWWCNIQDHILTGKAIPVRMHSMNAAHTLKHLGMQFDLIFIDASHDYDSIKEDILAWSQLLKPDGIICGHDYYPEGEEPFAWIGVRQAVQELFPDAQKVATSIWWSRSKPILPKPRIFDCFIFLNELDLLDVRFAELYDSADKFVLVEANLTHAGVPKPLYFSDNIQRYKKYLDKIIHIVVDDFPADAGDAWVRERWQRDAIMRGLTDCKDDDIIILGDADEIPSPDALRRYDPSQGLVRLKQRLLYCYLNLENPDGWDWQKIAPYSLVKQLSPCGIRYPPAGHTPIIEGGGWHFSFMGGPDAWAAKLEATAHQEYNRPELKDAKLAKERVEAGGDLLGREWLHYNRIKIDDSFPKYITENLQQFEDAGFIMHDEANDFVTDVKTRFPDYFHDKKVLEAGSLDVNGTPRRLFTDCDYTGIDLVEGYGVDAIAAAQSFVRPEQFDVVVSTEMLEHDQHWVQSLKQMFENLKPNGLMIITCAAPARAEHGTTRTETYSSPATTDYYRNISDKDFIGVLPMELWSDAELMYGRDEEDLYFFGVKKGANLATTWPAPLVLPTDISAAEELDAIQKWVEGDAPRLTVTACISTKDRYETTLTMAIASILNQTRKPEKLVIYDDGEQKDLREMSPFTSLFKLADDLGIEWEIMTTPRKGQVTNHQHCLETAATDLIFRCDDDCILEPNCLENLLAEMKDGVGAVAPLIHHPGNVSPLPPIVDGSLNDIALGLNLQWFNFNSGPREVEHLYSSFLIRVSALRDAGGYPTDLSIIGHHEESIASHKIFRAGYKLIVTPAAKAYHLREATGGIRSYNDQTLWEHDEQVWQGYLKAWGVVQPDTRLVVLDCGVGDTLLFKGILPELRRKFPDRKYTLSVCYPSVFEDDKDVAIISIADAKLVVGDRYDDYSLYAWMWKNNWKGHVVDAMREFWG